MCQAIPDILYLALKEEEDDGGAGASLAREWNSTKVVELNKVLAG